VTTRTHEPAIAGRAVEHSTVAIDRTFEATSAQKDAFLHGPDRPADRERGTREDFDNLAAEFLPV
jgi:hypothetical protein